LLYLRQRPAAVGAPQYIQTVNGVSYANVLLALRSLMTANGFDPGRVAYSSPWINSTDPAANCFDVYGDYARNDHQDNITQVINGGPIGVPDGWDLSQGGLPCSGSVNTDMMTSPIYSTQPNIVDMHIYPLVAGTTNTDAMVQQEAATDYGDVPQFLSDAGLTSATVVIGETYGGTLSPLNLGTPQEPNYCWLRSYQSPSGAPSDNVAGFNNESVTNPLSNFTVTFRPWMELKDPSGQCFAYGSGPGTPGNYQAVNYNGQGPYTPTNQ